MTIDKRIIEFNHKILDILDEYADVITFPSIRVREKTRDHNIHGYPVKGSNEIEFTVSFKCEDDLNTATDKIDTEYKSFLKDTNRS